MKTTEEIEALLLALPEGDYSVPPKGTERCVVVETRLGDVALFARLEPLGVDGEADDSIGIFMGYELHLTHPVEVRMDVWIVDKGGDRLGIRHSPPMTRNVTVVRSPNAVIVDARENRAVPVTMRRHLRSV